MNNQTKSYELIVVQVESWPLISGAAAERSMDTKANTLVSVVVVEVCMNSTWTNFMNECSFSCVTGEEVSRQSIVPRGRSPPGTALPWQRRRRGSESADGTSCLQRSLWWQTVTSKSLNCDIGVSVEFISVKLIIKYHLSLSANAIGKDSPPDSLALGRLHRGVCEWQTT